MFMAVQPVSDYLHLFFQGFFVALIFCLCNGEVHTLLRRTAARKWPRLGVTPDFHHRASMNSTQVTEAYQITDNAANKTNKAYIPMTSMTEDDAGANGTMNGGVVC